MNENASSSSVQEALVREVARLRLMVAGLGLALVACVAWLGLRTPSLPAVLSAERLEIVEEDGSLAFVLANSQRPVAATMDGQQLMAGQEEERRGVPSFVFFDGKGDEVGGMLTGVRTTAGGYSATRHLSFDGYKQDQTLVLAHYQDPEGSSAGLTVNDRPRDTSMLDALGQLGLRAGATRAEMQDAISALPAASRAERLGALFGVQRVFLGSNRTRNASLTMNDGAGRPRVIIDVPEEGAASIQILNENGEPVLRLPS